MSSTLIAPAENQSLLELPAITAVPELRYQPFPLTDLQAAYLAGRSGGFELGNVSTHLYAEFESRDLDTARLNLSWRRMIERHDMLRAVFLPDGRQQVLEHVPPCEIRVLDLRGKPAAEVDAELEAIRERMSHEVLPSDRWPIFNFLVCRLDESKYRLHVSLDMLTFDARSQALMFYEWSALYRDPNACLPSQQVSFQDYVAAESLLRQSAVYERDLQYWRKRMQSLPLGFDLPLVKDPRAVAKGKFASRAYRMEPEQWKALKAQAKRHGLGSSAMLLAAYAEVLQTWTKSGKFTINLTLVSRLARDARLNHVIGDYSSCLLLAVEDCGRGSFESRAVKLQQQLRADLEHSSVSGVRVIRELNRARPGEPGAAMPVVFTSMVGMRSPSGDSAPSPWLGEAGWLGENVYKITQTPQVWLDCQLWESFGALVVNWDAVEEIFPPGLLDEMFEAYCRLLRELGRDDEAWQASRFALGTNLLPQHQGEQRRAINATEAPISQELLHELAAAKVSFQPNHDAVVTPKRTLSYAELFRRANQVGHWLRRQGARPNSLVGVVMEKGWEQAVGVLGVLASGAAYLPIDATLPRERLAYLLRHGQVSLVLTQSWRDAAIEWPEGIERLCVDVADLLGLGDEPLEPIQRPDDLAYVIYTSGSTGTPKGVMIDHRGAVNTVLDINQRFEVGPSDSVLALSALNFDLSVYDIFGTLAAGGTVVMPDASAERDPAQWAELAARHRVTIWNTVPALMQMLVEYQAAHSARLPPTLRLVMMSGDWIPVDLPGRIRAMAGGDVAVISLGGATEASIWSILYPIGEVPPSWSSIPYGRPMRNQTFHVLNDRLTPCPVWVAGQLYIGGAGLAKGYWRDEEKTRASFIEHPESGERLYRTGDLGRYLPDGNIEFLGREDFQVKIRGHRIELGEIEAALLQHPRVNAAVAAAVGETRNERSLVAYVVPAAQEHGAREAEKISPVESAREVRPAVLTDPLERLKFKLRRPGLRRDEGRAVVSLATPEPDEELMDAYLRRRSFRRFGEREIPLAELSKVLSALRPLTIPGAPFPKYRYASAGSLYAVQAYLYVRPGRVEGVVPGTYYYHPGEHRLVELSRDAAIDHRNFAENRAIFDGSAFALFLVGQMDAITPMYGELAKDFCMIEAGLISQLLETEGPECGIGFCQIGGLDFAPMRPWFGLGEGHRYFHCLLGGPIQSEQLGVENFLRDLDEIRPLVDLAEAEVNSASIAHADAAASFAEAEHTSPEELKEFLRTKLPEYMVPATYVFLDALPLSTNGKVDRKALPVPHALPANGAGVRPQAGPLSPTEERVSRIWADVLGLPSVDVNDDFFELGGHSLMAIRVMSAIAGTFQVEVPLQALFEAPSVSRLAKKVDELTATARPEQAVVAVAPVDPLETRKETERLLIQIWERALGTGPLHAGDSFIGLQRNRNQLEVMLAEVRRAFGVFAEGFPLETFLKEPTIESMARIISGNVERQSSLVVCHQPRGTDRPLFLVHAAGGYVFFYRALASRLGPNRPVFGIRAEMASDNLGQPFESSASVQEVAARYIAEMKTVQPEGPYLLGGACAGGILAFEMLKQLRAAGEDLAGPLLLFDPLYRVDGSWSAGRDGAEPFTNRVRRNLDRAAQIGTEHPVLHLPLKAATGALLQAGRATVRIGRAVGAGISHLAKARGNGGPVEAPAADERLAAEERGLALFAAVFKATERLVGRYRPEPQDCRAVLFVSPGTIGAVPFWKELARQGVTVQEMPGRHLEMLEEPTVARVATIAAKHLQCG